MTNKEYLSLACDLPFAVDGSLSDGRALGQPKFCAMKCTRRDCLRFVGQATHHVICSHGFSCYPLQALDGPAVLNGLIVTGLNQRITSDRRRALRENVVSSSAVEATIARINWGRQMIEGAIGQAAKDSVSFLHDVRTSVGLVLSWCQTIIGRAPGTTFDDKLAHVDRASGNLFQAISLLKEQLDLGDIIVNPAAITYGPKRQSSLIGFLYRMTKLFGPRAETRGCEIQFVGGRDLEITTWNSFQFIPLVLIDNALKYSFRNRTIKIHVWEEANVPWFSVSSYGRTVPENLRAKIFDKYTRAPAAFEEHPEGMGLGLFIAKQIADAHGFRILYRGPEPDVAVGNNEFLVQLLGK